MEGYAGEGESASNLRFQQKQIKVYSLVQHQPLESEVYQISAICLGWSLKFEAFCLLPSTLDWC